MSEELKVEKIIEKMDLKILTPDIDVGSKVVMVPDLTQPDDELRKMLYACVGRIDEIKNILVD